MAETNKPQEGKKEEKKRKMQVDNPLGNELQKQERVDDVDNDGDKEERSSCASLVMNVAFEAPESVAVYFEKEQDGDDDDFSAPPSTVFTPPPRYIPYTVSAPPPRHKTIRSRAILQSERDVPSSLPQRLSTVALCGPLSRSEKDKVKTDGQDSEEDEDEEEEEEDEEKEDLILTGKRESKPTKLYRPEEPQPRLSCRHVSCRGPSFSSAVARINRKRRALDPDVTNGLPETIPDLELWKEKFAQLVCFFLFFLSGVVFLKLIFASHNCFIRKRTTEVAWKSLPISATVNLNLQMDISKDVFKRFANRIHATWRIFPSSADRVFQFATFGKAGRLLQSILKNSVHP